MFENMNKSEKEIISQVVRGGIARVINDHRVSTVEKTLLVKDNKIILVQQCRSRNTDEHLREPIAKQISKAQALKVCEQMVKESIVYFVDDDCVEVYHETVDEINQKQYEY